MRRLTHSGIDIATLNKRWDISREIMQELVEGLVFGGLALSFWLVDDGPGDAIGNLIHLASIIIALMLAGFALNRLFVICQLLFRLRDLGR